MKRKVKKNTNSKSTNYRSSIASKNYNYRPINSQLKKKKRKRKVRINKFKVYRNLFFICLIIFAVFFLHNYLVQKNIAKQNALLAAKQQQQEVQKAQADLQKKNEFFSTEITTLNDLQRYNQNVGLLMNYPNSEANVYPDSLNAATALKNNLTTYAQYLTSSELSTITEFINNVVTANTAYINAIEAYNKNINLASPNLSIITSQKNAINNAYTNLNNIISQGQSVLANK